MGQFKALLIEEQDGKTVSGLTEMDDSQLDPGEVTIRVAYSSINYKDALAATGAGRIIRRFPCVGGIDLSGTVEASSDARFKPGDPVIATSFDIGVAHHGGYAERARVPAAWVVPLPETLSLYEAMALGTAGFTAALGIVRMEENGLKPGNGPVIVTGATGGVGSTAVSMLAGLGYEVVASTGKPSSAAWLTDLGATSVIDRAELSEPGRRPLESTVWAGAVDCVGGVTLANVLKKIHYGGAVAASGLTGGNDLPTTVLPFILRGVCLLGIDSVMTPIARRCEVWGRIASDLKPAGLASIGHDIGLDDLDAVLTAILAGQAEGRSVVDLGR